MSRLDRLDRLFVIASLVIQAILVIFFALRKWDLPLAMKLGWIVYALALPAFAVSIALIRARKAWYLPAAGILFALWAVLGVFVDLVYRVEWRSPIVWQVFVPYVSVYVASLMFYWWPLARIHRPSWFIFAGLFALSTLLNITSHG